MFMFSISFFNWRQFICSVYEKASFILPSNTYASRNAWSKSQPLRMRVTCALHKKTSSLVYPPWFPIIRQGFEWQCSPDDTMMQLNEEEDHDQWQPARQHPANRLRYPVGIASVNDERDGERHLAVSSHSFGIPVTGSPPPQPSFCNHRRREERPSTLSTHYSLPLTPWYTTSTCTPTYTMYSTQTRTHKVIPHVSR